jgi:hypothetical protein
MAGNQGSHQGHRCSKTSPRGDPSSRRSSQIASKEDLLCLDMSRQSTACWWAGADKQLRIGGHAQIIGNMMAVMSR